MAAREEIVAAFIAADTDADSTLSEEEVERATGMDPRAIKRAFMHVDSDENGLLDMEEYVVFYRAFIEKDAEVLKTLKEQYYRRVFKRFDSNNDGKLDIEENVAAVQFMERGDASEDAVKAMVAEADKDGDG
jgi:Ca2+-binding EF-hand superfamily protein